MPSIVVFEKRPRWGPELQRQFLREDVRVRACRSVNDIPTKLDAVSENVIVLDLESAPADCLQFLGRTRSDSVCSSVVVIGSGSLTDLEWPVRELGAISFLNEPVSGVELAKLCRRQWSLKTV